MTSPTEQPDHAECRFCAIIAGDPHGQIYYADHDVVAFLDIAPASKGHTLVVPRVHATDIFDIGDEQFGAAARGAQRVAAHLDQRLHPDGLTVIQSNRAAGWQDVFHLHFHLVPRYAGDGLIRPWQPAVASEGHLSALTGFLRQSGG